MMRPAGMKWQAPVVLALAVLGGCGDDDGKPGEDETRGDASIQALTPPLPQRSQVPLPAHDVECITEFRDPELGVRKVYRYTAKTRRLEDGTFYYDFNAKGQLVEEGSLDGEWAYELTYDDHGARTNLKYIWRGQELPQNSSHQENTYEGGRLVRVVRTSGDGLGNGEDAITYDAQARITTITTEAPWLEAPWVQSFHYDAQGRLVSIEIDADLRSTYAYDESGRLLSIERHRVVPGGPGYAEARIEYYYDGSRLVEVAIDGGSPHEYAPEADGVFEDGWTLSEGCAQLIALDPTGIAHVW